MATKKSGGRRKPTEYLNSQNAASVANRGMNAAYTQAHGQPIKNAETGKWEEGDMVTQTKTGKMSIDGRKAGGKTHAMTPKNNDGSAVIGKSGKVRQSGRSQIASRSQRYYDTRAGFNNITEKALQAMIESGQATVVEGGVDVGGGIILKKNKEGNYSMGLSNG